MKALFIGGTGTISMAITRLIAAHPDWELTLLNRGTRKDALPAGVRTITANISDEAAAAKALDGLTFDCVCDFIAFEKAQLERDFRLFNGKTKQFIFISSASAYQKPLSDALITESTPLHNPHWAYSRSKIECEEYLLARYREDHFPVTIVRPSHTYDERNLPLALKGAKGAWQVIRRMQEGKRVLIHGDGTSLWTITHNTDFAKGFAGLLGNAHAIGQAYHITSDESVTWNQIYAIIADELGVPLHACHVPSDFLCGLAPYDFEGSLLGDKAHSVLFDNSKIKRAVPGFVCTVRADQGLRKTVRHLLSTPALQQEDPEFDAFCDRVSAALDAAKDALRRA